MLWVVASASVAALSAPSYADGVVKAGKVVSVEGKVLIRQDGGKSGPAIPMRPGLMVKEGDLINTASDGKAKILLEDKTILDIGPSALFKVEKFAANNGGDRNVGLSMPYGTTRVSVSKPIAKGGKFQIRTRTATMGVRGTEFVVQSAMAATPAAMIGSAVAQTNANLGVGKTAAKAPETQVTVIQGKVEVEQTKTKKEESKPGEARKPAAAPVMLTAGTQLTTTEDAPPAKPVTLDTAKVAEISAATKVEDNTFSKAVTLDLSGTDSSGTSAAGEATRAAVAAAIAAPQNTLVTPSSTGFIGTFSPTQQMPITPFIPPGGGMYKVHIVVTQ